MAAGLIVQKYGGSSLSSPEQIQAIAERIAARARDANRIIVAVSAMGSSTDELLRLAYRITPQPPRRELDMLLSVGERTSMALLSMALNSIGCKAISFTGSQCGIVTSVSHTRALIQEIRGDRIEEALSQGQVVIVAGFQGVSRTKEITTLGRGGSDTTAVALAARLDASACEIYTDVPGVFTADPRIVKNATGLPRINYDEMLELAVLGAKVLHYRAAELARRYRVPLHLLSSFDDSGGTVVRSSGDKVEYEQISSITSKTDVALVRVIAKSHDVGIPQLMRRIVENDIQLTNYHCASGTEETTVTVVVERENLDTLLGIISALPTDGLRTETHDDVASVSIVGSGIACSARTISEVERVLTDAKIPVYDVGTSSLSVTCIVPEPARKHAVEILHMRFIEKGRIRSKQR
ncbi:MAG: aspartate kinase [Candidatus Latescibacterota bacterium]|nr:MAG: aspartate kinase [Candidatus Latescibacterota bacterium]